eukprot:336433-Pyramimonas_sp.AAC.1
MTQSNPSVPGSRDNSSRRSDSGIVKGGSPSRGGSPLSRVRPPPARITVETHVRAGVMLKGTELEKCYEGPLVNGLRHGSGTYEYPNRYFKYAGDYVEGRKH